MVGSTEESPGWVYVGRYEYSTIAGLHENRRHAGHYGPLVVFVGVEQGILIAMILSLLRVVDHSYHPHTEVLKETPDGIWHLSRVIPGAITAPGLVIYRFGAPLFYANANRFSEEVMMLANSAPAPLHWFIVDAGAITNVDFTAGRVVREVQKQLCARGTGLVLAHVESDLKPALDRHQLTKAIGPTLIFDSLHEALAALRERVPSGQIQEH